MERKYIALICFVVIAIAYWVITQNNWAQTKETVKKDGNLTRGQIEEQNKKIEELKNLIHSNPENKHAFLRQLLGDNYEEILKDDESYNTLYAQLEQMSLHQILMENRRLQEELKRVSFQGNKKRVELIVEYINAFKYESARKEIDDFIEQDPKLNPKDLALLFALKSQTYYGKSLNHTKKKELLIKALELDKSNPAYTMAYANYLSYNHNYERSTKILKELLQQNENGLFIHNYIKVDILVLLASDLFMMELLKPESERNFYEARKHWELAEKVNDKLPNEYSRADIIYRSSAKLEIQTGFLDKAIKLLNQSLDFSKNNSGNLELNDLNNKAFCHLYLGHSYKLKFKKKQEDSTFKIAKESYLRALSFYEQFNEGNHVSFASIYWSLADLVIEKGEIEDSINFAHKAISIYESYEIPNYYELGNAYATLARGYSINCDLPNAKKYQRKSLITLRKVLPENHDLIKIQKGNLKLLDTYKC